MSRLYQVGDKVIPIDKTVMGRLGHSHVWNTARDHGRDYIYVASFEDGVYVCDSKPNTRTGDYFRESDLIPYPPNNRVMQYLLKKE